MKSKKYSIEWKSEQMRKKGGWAQDFINRNDGNAKQWKWHTIRYSTEYRSAASWETKKQCEQANKENVLILRINSDQAIAIHGKAI